MAPLRFRVWDRDRRQMFEPNVHCEDIAVGRDGGLYGIDPDGHYCWVANPSRFVVMQFTGLYDKNGVTIFEGDILATRFGREQVTEVMTWDQERAQWDRFHPLDRFEVIGNIHQHPELLTKEGR
jgi:uncharacterized phage protein (TIGR01671 family)